MKIAVFIIAVLSFTAAAHAAPTKDMSLSPAESFREQDTAGQADVNTTTPNSDYTAPIGSGAPSTSQGANPALAKRFMDAYCGNAAQGAGYGNTLAACLKKTRADACARFAQLPADAQAVVDQKIVCVNVLMEQQEGAAPPESCKTIDTSYLQVLEKYSKDPSIAGALAAIPKMVNNPAEFCSAP